MAKKKRKENSRQPTKTIVPELPPGIKLVRTFRGHKAWIGRIAWSQDGRMLASPSEDKTIRLWDTETGECLRTLEAHNGGVNSVAFDPEGRTLASASDDATIKLWEAVSGRLLRTLEGHTSNTNWVAFSCDGELLATKSADHTIRLWNTGTGACVGIIPEPASDDRLNGLAFHPRLPILATVGSDPGTPEGARDRLIHIWKLDLAVLLGQPSAIQTSHYVNAKVVLLGDTAGCLLGFKRR